MDLLGKAIARYYRGEPSEDLRSINSLDSSEIVPVDYFFRSFEQMPILEQQALELCQGTVLDIGCGAGSHCLYLQDQGFKPLGLDISCLATEVAELRGVRKTVCEDIMEYKVGKFDTLLLLMNGIGLAGSLHGLRKFLLHLSSLLNPGGQILLDSSDIIYMYEADQDGGYWVPGDVDYYGEVTYQWELGALKSSPFPWLFIDFNTLNREAELLGYQATLLESGPHFDYLARLTR